MHYEIKTGGSVVYEGRIIRLHLDDVMLEDHSRSKREYVEHPGGAAIVAETEKGIIFVEQFRYPVSRTLLELPAGKLDKGEDPLSAARREFEEETGYFAKELQLLGEMYPSPGYTDEVIYLYLATGLEMRQAHRDEGEFLSVKYLPAEKAAEMIASGEIKDAKTVIALLKYLCFFRGR